MLWVSLTGCKCLCVPILSPQAEFDKKGSIQVDLHSFSLETNDDLENMHICSLYQSEISFANDEL